MPPSSFRVGLSGRGHPRPPIVRRVSRRRCGIQPKRGSRRTTAQPVCVRLRIRWSTCARFRSPASGSDALPGEVDEAAGQLVTGLTGGCHALSAELASSSLDSHAAFQSQAAPVVAFVADVADL
jgi:hypothetical protein